MRGTLYFAFLLAIMIMFFSASVSAYCNSTQIDINTASSAGLDKIVGVGSATAAKIIAARPFSSVDDLIRVNGVGNKTLEKIKEQGLACVADSVSSGNETSEAENQTQDEIPQNSSNQSQQSQNQSQAQNQTGTQIIFTSSASATSPYYPSYEPPDIQPAFSSYNVIRSTQSSQKVSGTAVKSASQKNINTQNGTQENKTYAIYGFISFCILLSVLLILKIKGKEKNEFR